MSLTKIYLAALKMPWLGVFLRRLVVVLKQWPWVRPAGIILSASAWIEQQNACAGWYARRRGGWCQTIHPAGQRVSKPPRPGFEPLPAPFRAEAIRTLPAACVTYLPNVYLFSDQGAVFSRDNRIFDEFVHHFDVPLRRGPYFRAFYTFTGRIEKRPEWIALLAAPEGRNYYHWLFDVLPRLHLLETWHERIELYAVPGNLSVVQRESLGMLGVTDSQLLFLQPRRKLFCERLLAPSLPGSEGSVPGWTVRFLRESFLQRLPREPQAGSAKIYLSRRQTAARPLLNEDQVTELMVRRGYEVIVPERLSLLEQVAVFARARCVVGVHGAAFSNVVFSDRANVLEIFSPDYLRPDCYYTLADQCGHRYWYLVGRSSTAGAMPWGSVEVDPEALQRLLDEMEASSP